MHIERLDQLLDKERQRLGATSCTFYVRDPFWVDELRLVCMPGVRLRETMHGFVFTDLTKRLLAADPVELFCRTSELPSPTPEETVRTSIPSELSYLFSDFAGREGVKAFARLCHAHKPRADAVLFVNFSEEVNFDDILKARIRSLLRKAAGSIAEVTEELRLIEADHLAESVKILHPAQSLVKLVQGGNSSGVELTTHFENILKLTLDALQISKADGVGTVHLYEPEEGLLRLSAFYGNAPKITEAKEQKVFEGQGIISWVTLQHKALLITNLPKSDFDKIKVVVKTGIKSELAVPMIADGELGRVNTI